ncbi:SchA/CurD-like domain-containing protein [Nonomuraea cavernae]|uniref:SchA/CurD n=1 Tax=Nonomuraea cavernae TaxID=2045107 RepID=A0A917ZI06_9ACTN|nr:SchA/CurD-like domain-containing protein [Nonomuraea cavernae]MCA2189466.1 SchA/CurD [Nonomuraea cavernae]GGO82187.1 SchA/CurD [Nonomuraea cavernae]
MTYAAITYRVKPGHEDEIAEIFQGFQRVGSSVLRDEQGNEVGRLLGTAVFIKDDLMVRVIHFEGTLEAVSANMAKHGGVHKLEKQLAPYLVRERDTSSPDKFGAYFRDATMRCISQLSADTRPVEAS